MSGLEILQIFASAVTVAEFTLKILQFIQSVKHVDRHVKELTQKIKQLHGNVTTVQTLVEHRQDQEQDRVVSREFVIWRRLKSSLRKSKRLLEEFEKAFKMERAGSNIIRGVTIELRLKWGQQEIEMFEHNLDAHVQTTQLCVLSLLV